MKGIHRMSLRHALLALIEAGPFTGYDLSQKFSQTVQYVWRAGHSQIYPELRKLESAGLVSSKVVPRGDAQATKVTYSLTEGGLEQLKRWVDEIGPQPAVREPQYLKALYLEFSSLVNAQRQFEEHFAFHEGLRDRYAAHLEDIEHARTDLMRRRFAQAPESEHRAIQAFKAHVYRGLIARAEADMTWAAAGVALVKELADDDPDPDAWTKTIHSRPRRPSGEPERAPEPVTTESSSGFS